MKTYLQNAGSGFIKHQNDTTYRSKSTLQLDAGDFL